MHQPAFGRRPAVEEQVPRLPAAVNLPALRIVNFVKIRAGRLDAVTLKQGKRSVRYAVIDEVQRKDLLNDQLPGVHTTRQSINPQLGQCTAFRGGVSLVVIIGLESSNS